MTEHYPRVRLYASGPEGERLVQREVIRLVMHLPHDHHTLSVHVNRALDVYLDALSAGAATFSEYSLGDEEYSLGTSGWERVRAALSPPTGARFLEDMEDPQALLRYVKNQYERTIELSSSDTGVSGYGFFYWARLPWCTRTRVADEVSLVSFSWPTEYLEERGPERMRERAMELASLLPFSSGHAGLAFYSPNAFTASLKGIHEAAFRHPGLDVAHGSTTLGPRVDGVHWLNFLGQPVLGALGGATGLRSRLRSPTTTVQELDDEHAVVTLGQWPEAGDLTQGRNLPEYCEFARALEPYLNECAPRCEFHDSSHEETLRWWRRFLD